MSNVNVVETVEDLMILTCRGWRSISKEKDEVSIRSKLGRMKNTSRLAKNDFKPRYSDYISLFLFLKLASSSENEYIKGLQMLYRLIWQK